MRTTRKCAAVALAATAELSSDVSKLKAAHIAPIAIGSKDRWPDAFYWDCFAVRECSTDQLKQAIKAINVSAPCFTKAGQDVKAFMATKPFQTGFPGTAAQQGAGSSAGMVANGKAAMAGASTTMVTYLIDKGFRSLKFGYGSAVAVLLFIISFLFALAYQRWALRRDTTGALTGAVGG